MEKFSDVSSATKPILKENKKTMKTCFARVGLLVVLAVVASVSLASAQDVKAVKGRYVVLPPRLRYDVVAPPASLQTWNGSFSYQGTNYPYNMVGTAPSTQFFHHGSGLHDPTEGSDHGEERNEDHV